MESQFSFYLHHTVLHKVSSFYFTLFSLKFIKLEDSENRDIVMYLSGILFFFHEEVSDR